MNKSFSSNRKNRYRYSLSMCDNDKVRIEYLLDKIIQLEDSLNELQHNYMELLISCKSIKSCVPLLF